MDDLDRALAAGLRAHLADRQLSNRTLATAMRGLGFHWTGNTVSQIATGRRSVSVLEAGALCEALQVPLDLLTGDARIAASMQGHFGHWQVDEAEPEREATCKAARQLGMSPTDVDTAAKRLWGGYLEDERDRRLGSRDGLSPRSLQARRGHVTRALLGELAAHLKPLP